MSVATPKSLLIAGLCGEEGKICIACLAAREVLGDAGITSKQEKETTCAGVRNLLEKVSKADFDKIMRWAVEQGHEAVITWARGRGAMDYEGTMLPAATAKRRNKPERCGEAGETKRVCEKNEKDGEEEKDKKDGEEEKSEKSGKHEEPDDGVGKDGSEELSGEDEEVDAAIMSWIRRSMDH